MSQEDIVKHIRELRKLSSKDSVKKDEKPELSSKDSVKKDEKPELSSKDSVKKDEKLQENLRDIKAREGIIGYILRGSKAASIDLKDSTNVIEYAVLSAAAFEKAQDMVDTHEIGNIGTIVLEGKEVKMLLATVGDDRLSVLMEKNVDHNQICKDLDLA